MPGVERAAGSDGLDSDSRGQDNSGLNLISLGVVTRAHGIHGRSKLRLHNPDSETLYGMDTVFLQQPGPGSTKTGEARDYLHATRVRILSMDPIPNGHAILRFDGCADRNQAEALVGAEVLVPRGALAALDETSWYDMDLVGLRVLEDGHEIGSVADVFHYPTVDCLAVKMTDGSLVEVPMRDPWLVRVDLAGNTVELHDVSSFRE